MDYMEAQDMKEIMSVKRNECPRCKSPLEHFSGAWVDENNPTVSASAEYFYCPLCLDKGYNFDGEVIVRLE